MATDQDDEVNNNRQNGGNRQMRTRTTQTTQTPRRNCRWNGGRNGRRVEVVTIRRCGTRYPTQSELRRMELKRQGLPTRKTFLRFLVSFALIFVIGSSLLAFGASFISRAKKYQEDKHSSLPVVFCIFSIVLGILMHMGGFVLAYYIVSHKMWRQMNSNRNAEGTTTTSNQAIPHQDSCASLSPPDPENAPPLYSVCQEHALAPPSLHFINSNSSDPESPSVVTPEILFVLPSYEDIINDKAPPGGYNLPPAYYEKTPDEHLEQSESNNNTDIDQNDQNDQQTDQTDQNDQHEL